MKAVAYIDIEVNKDHKIVDIGATNDCDEVFHSSSLTNFAEFLKGHEYLCGHNVLEHDLKYMKDALNDTGMLRFNVVDTLYLSALLFPKKPYHSLLKDEKLLSDELNNPLADAQKARRLFHDEIEAFRNLEEPVKQIFYLLLGMRKEFAAFFRYIGYNRASTDIEKLIRGHFASKICTNADIAKLIADEPIALAFALASINTGDRYSVIPQWVLKKYPQVDWIIDLLRNRPCHRGCPYCDRYLDAHWGLNEYFGYDGFRTFAGEPLQERAVKAALANKSMLAIFPTGGGKSITFQVPALMSGESVKGLTVVISPLQSLMKDQVDNLEKLGITDAVTINGMLDPIERANSLARVEDGSASILYISPELLRSKTIEHLLIGRKIARFVIDEAHCFSAWGQDFRVDYLYIGDFIKNLQDKKRLTEGIPVSCFTATAKQKVVEDIKAYFKDKLNLDLVVFNANASRHNLRYKVLQRSNDAEKYEALRSLLQQKDCPTIVYVSRTRTTERLAERLTADGFLAKPYHGQMEMREKLANQDAFMSGEVPIMVATSAFGMGVDKKDVGMVIHYEISDSLENYVQEAGRAARDENISADCYILFCEEDLDKHFVMLNQNKLNVKEIQQIWKAIRDLTKTRKRVSQSALEIANRAGWDEGINQLETRVRTAIAALEQAGFVKRGQNMPRVFADSIKVRNAQEAIDRINASSLFEDKDKEDAIRIVKRLISSRSQNADDPAAYVDYIAEHLGMPKERVIASLNLLREEGLLADSKDLTAFIKRNQQVNRSLQILDLFCRLEKFLLEFIDEEIELYNIKEINQKVAEAGLEEVTPAKIRVVLNCWKIKKLVDYKFNSSSRNIVHIKCMQSKLSLLENLSKRQDVARVILEHLFKQGAAGQVEQGTEEVLVDFSVHELKRAYEENMYLFKTTVTIKDIEDALYYLTRIDAIKIEGGFMVIYNPMTIERVDDLKKRYSLDDYSKLKEYYEQKIQQIHIVGEYARKMIADYREALQFLDDYFKLNYRRFLNKYFPNRGEEISRNITPTKFRQLFGELSPRQLAIINDQKSKYICVLAGPGSGKTKVLVHKLASLILMEDVKYEQLLMLTFSRAAATEFKQRLLHLVGAAAHFIEIKTFHSYCFDLLGRVGSIEKSDEIIQQATEKIMSGEVETSRITKTVLVIDEAQDIDEVSYGLIKALIEQNETMRVIMVGDDDQNIFSFRKSSAKYMASFIADFNATRHELLENYRSQKNLVEFANQFAMRMKGRLKQQPIIPHRHSNGFIRVIKYNQQNFIVPFVEDIAEADLVGSTCALVRRNDDALQVAGMLQKRGIKAKLIQSNEKLNLYNLDEVRFFCNLVSGKGQVALINEELWQDALAKLKSTYHRSTNLDVFMRLLKAFEASCGKYKYLSDLFVFLRESELEDFYSDLGETIFVSTIHKAKGKEFANVFLLLDSITNPNEEEKREIYVAMTRAKNNLNIHVYGNYLNHISAENLIRHEQSCDLAKPDELALQLGYSDVFLNFFTSRQNIIQDIQSGDRLEFKDGFGYTKKSHSVFKLSKAATERLQGLSEQGFTSVEAKVSFIVWWKGQNEDKEIKIVLPELYLQRTNP